MSYDKRVEGQYALDLFIRGLEVSNIPYYVTEEGTYWSGNWEDPSYFRAVHYNHPSGEVWVMEEYLKTVMEDCDSNDYLGVLEYKEGERPTIPTPEVIADDESFSLTTCKEGPQY